VLHVNHPNEITQELAAALAPLKNSGVSLLNQSVLLKGINDSAVILSELSEKLFSVGVLPYYCHLLDPVQGAAHFDVEKLDAKKIEAELKATLPGYLVPKFVREVPHASSKIALAELAQ
jgi:L-lysine 2,3-aminomutase